jgi:hypothetical protein
MLLQASRAGLLLHPLIDDLPCHVLQYADDTLIILCAIPEHVANLKKVLDDFSAATGLVINFHKIPLLPGAPLRGAPLLSLGEVWAMAFYS